MFTNGVVASVKIYRDDDGDIPGIRPPGRHTARIAGSWDGSPLDAGSRLGRDASRAGSARRETGVVVACGPAPQEGSKT
jgi:hypothetical protein